jgi:hypothetical protein
VVGVGRAVQLGLAIMSVEGQNPKNSNRVYVFRCSSNNGHGRAAPMRIKARPLGLVVCTVLPSGCRRMLRIYVGALCTTRPRFSAR